jgi:3'(2'), 5'-bisphosphate nucleotidase
MASEDFTHELRVACTAVQLCSILTQKVQQATLNSENSISKADFSPVTVGDFAVQALLTSAIHGTPAFKGDEFLAEESADELRKNGPLLEKVWELVEEMKPVFNDAKDALVTPVSSEEVMEFIDFGGKNERSDAGRMWVFDPIDGTQTFLRGQQ